MRQPGGAETDKEEALSRFPEHEPHMAEPHPPRP